MARTDRLVRQHLRDRFLVTLKTAEAFDGVLVDADDGHLVLADAGQVDGKGQRIPVDGHLWLQRGNVAYMQATTVPMPGWTA